MRNSADEVVEFTEHLPNPEPVHYCENCDHYDLNGGRNVAKCRVSVRNESDKYVYRDWEPDYNYCACVRLSQGVTCEWYRREE